MTVDDSGPGECAPEMINVTIAVLRNRRPADGVQTPTPCEQGWVPGTLDTDGEPVRVLLVTNVDSLPGTIRPVRPIGLLTGTKHRAVVAVPHERYGPGFADIHELTDLPPTLVERLCVGFGHTDRGTTEQARMIIRAGIEQFAARG
ncbi:inorganic diphosphatase [Nocardia vaccinii]|uniref:inorganic diphosphatase n=1 Tax=Nocardia vaccinii TaxID=1822 RepID=UPI00082EF682|nr:inorganic diphosphatase [Nocardia vaccinii]